MTEITNLKELLKKDLQNVTDFALVFGSFAIGNFNHESDIDIGIYVNDKLYSEETIADIIDKFNELTDREIDIVVLNDADPIIIMQILANGKLINCKDKHQFNLYKARKISEYLDFKMSRKIIEDNLLK